MKLTLSWLKDHLETDASLAEIVERLTSIGLEVESVDDKASLKPFVIAKVLTAVQHPDADRLRILECCDQCIAGHSGRQLHDIVETLLFQMRYCSCMNLFQQNNLRHGKTLLLSMLFTITNMAKSIAIIT